MEALDRIKRIRVQLQRKNPFFAYLSMSLKPIESVRVTQTMGVDIYGNLYYNPKFVEDLQEDELMGVMIHEILHLALLHIIRTGDRNQKIKNISDDIVVNQLIKDNKFVLPKGVLWSDENNDIEIFNKKILAVNTKTSEEIYDELYDELKNQLKQAIKSGKLKMKADGSGECGDGDGDGIEIEIDDYELEGSSNEDTDVDGNSTGIGKVGNIDNHIKGDMKGMSNEEKKKKEKEWLDKVQEAYIGSKMVGKVPVGIERVIGQLHESRINWKALLLRYIESYICSDYTYSRCSKKSISSGFFMPDTIKERVEVAVAIDVSGSIGTEELNDFVSEIVGIARAFRNKLKMTLFTHETNMVDEWSIENGSVEKIKQIKIKGGGGTSFITPYDEFMKKHKNTKYLVWLTDGYGDTLSKRTIPIIWCLSKNSSDEIPKQNGGKIVKLK